MPPTMRIDTIRCMSLHCLFSFVAVPKTKKVAKSRPHVHSYVTAVFAARIHLPKKLINIYFIDAANVIGSHWSED